MLRVAGLAAGYRDQTVVRDIHVEVAGGTSVAILGANGAGKSTLLRAISGQIRVTAGHVTLDGVDLTGARPDQLVKAGIVHVPEGRGIFGGMSVLENLLVGAHTRGKRHIHENLERVLTEFPMLRLKLHERGASLSGGQQQMLAIGRGLMANPKVLLLDEPTVGLAPIVVEELVQTLSSAGKDRDTAVLLVEQNVVAALECTSYVYLLDKGVIVASSPTNELSEEKILSSYLGTSVSDAVEVSRDETP